MQVTVTYRWTERDVVPPRCRKPRDVQRTGTVEVTVPEVGEADAPVAFTVRNIHHPSEPDIFRWYDGRLYTLYRPWSRQREPSLAGSNYFPAEVGADHWDRPRSPAPNAEEAEASLIEHYATTYLIIDGIVWRLDGEPRYVVMTFGLGHNHGGTGVMNATYYNPNVPKTRYFRADDHNGACALGLQIAEARGDTDDLPRIMDLAPDIDVVIPEAVRCQPATEHGDGDPFLNQLDRLTQAAPDALTAGILALGALANTIGDS